MVSSTIEIGTPVGASEIREAAHQREGQKAAVAKQRAGKRGKASIKEVHAVDRRIGGTSRREASKVHLVDHGIEKNWRPAYSLPSFPDPPGFSLCWIARHSRRHGDEANLLASLRQGWIPVKPDELEDQDLPVESFTGRLAKYGEVIGDETTILMKLPDRMKAQRDAHYNGKRDKATRAVTRRKPGLAEATTQMPLVEDRNEVSTDFARMRARRPPSPESGE